MMLHAGGNLMTVTRGDVGRICRLDPAVVARHSGSLSLESDSDGTRGLRDFRPDQIEGADWYKRRMRAHANCIENLPVFGAIVFGLYVENVAGALVDALAIAVLVARILQSLVHVFFVQTNTVLANRKAALNT
jgi:uncharacterized MAPEG superfamily protein